MLGKEAASSSAIAGGAIFSIEANGKQGNVKSPWVDSRLG